MQGKKQVKVEVKKKTAYLLPFSSFTFTSTFTSFTLSALRVQKG